MNHSNARLYSLILGSLLLPSSPSVLAQAAPGVVETLLVTGERGAASAVSESMLVKTEADFSVGARIDPAELLHNIPGVQVDSRTNYAQDTRISLRGFGARSAFGVRGIDLQVDGIPLSTPDGQGQLASVMLDTIASVQVLRGPIAALYGNGAGGVIGLQSAVPDASAVRAGAIAGDAGLARQTLNGEWRGENLALRAQFANTRIDGARPHSRAERQQAGVQVFYTTDNNLDVIVKHDYSDDPLLQDPLGLTPDQWRNDPWQRNPAADMYDTRKTVAHQQTAISLRDTRGATRWQTGLWQGERAITQHLGFAGAAISGSGGVVDLQRDFSGLNGSVTRSVNLLSWSADITLGAEFAQTQDERRGYVNELGASGALRRDESGGVDSRDIYALIHLNPTDKFMFYTGMRHTDLDFEVEDNFIVVGNPDDSGARAYRENAVAIGGNYALSSGWQLFASSGRGYETPTLTELAYKTGATGLNTALEAATNRQHEWGIGYHSQETVELRLTQFFIATNNEIVVDQSVGGRTTFRNAAETERAGIELWARFAIHPKVQLQVAMQSLDARYSAGQWTGNQLPGVAREHYQLGIQWQPVAEDVLQFDLAAQQRSRIYAADNNEIYAPDYYTLDASMRGAYAVQSVQLDWWLTVANLSDAHYVGSVIVNQANGRAFEPALGRNFSAGIRLTHQFD